MGHRLVDWLRHVLGTWLSHSRADRPSGSPIERPSGPSRSGRPVFLTLLKWREQRPDLVARCERLLADRGIDPPTPD